MLLDLPQDAEGLAWIASQGPARLLRIPGVEPATIAAAARGDQQALVCLRITAQQHAAWVQRLGSFAAFKLAASGATTPEAGHSQTRSDHQLKAVYQERLHFTGELMVVALEGGELAAFRWLRALCHPFQFGFQAALMTAAARGGHLKILQFLRSEPSPAPWDENVSSAAAWDLDCLKWLLTQDPPCPCDHGILWRVVEEADLDALKFLRTCPSVDMSWWTECTDLITLAATHDSLPILKWLRGLDPPSPWTEEACEFAADNGNFNVLKWLHSQDPPCPWDEMCAEAAARKGRIHMLEWMSEQDPPCPWGAQSSDAAAQEGHLETLQFLQSHGCSVAGTAYYSAASGGRRQILTSGHKQVLRWLHDQKLPVPDQLISSGRWFSPPSLLFLGDIGAELLPDQRAELLVARRTFCTFHGLLRWCRSAVSDPSRGANSAFDYLSNKSAGQELLVLLSQLPSELVTKIAVAAHLQHDIFQ